MSRYLISGISNFFNRLEILLPQIFRSGGYPPEILAIADLPNHFGAASVTASPDKFSLKELLGDGILWAVPKHRRTVEKRLKRKFGHPDYVWKMLKIKTHLRVCNQCGHDHEVGVLCSHCYEKVRKETEQMQDAIQQELGLQPVEQEVVVLYEGEKSKQTSEFVNGKRIVEISKPRPMWFTKNLLQKTTQQPATTKEVKPSNLA